MKVLVTGASGYVGAALARSLLERGDDVRILQRSDSPRLAALGATIHRADLRDPESLRRATDGVECVFHTAAKVGVWGRGEDFASINVGGTERLLAACRAHGVRRFVFTSSASVVFGGDDEEGVDESTPFPDRPLSAYTRTKAEAEQLVLSAADDDLATIALRPHLVWGPGDPHFVGRILQRVRQRPLALVGDGNKKVDSTYIDNAVAAHLLADASLAPGAPCCGKAYFISNGEPWKIAELINGILAAAEMPPVTRSVSPRLAHGVAAVLEFIHKALRLEAEPELTRFVVREFATSHYFDITAARRDLGYEPTVSINEGLKRLHESLFPS